MVGVVDQTRVEQHFYSLKLSLAFSCHRRFTYNSMSEVSVAASASPSAPSNQDAAREHGRLFFEGNWLFEDEGDVNELEVIEVDPESGSKLNQDYSEKTALRHLLTASSIQNQAESNNRRVRYPGQIPHRPRVLMAFINSTLETEKRWH